MAGLLAFYAFALGAIVGSFLNVIIHRYPRQQSIVFPASHCPHCNTPIRWYDNIPLASYVVLGGKCRSCRGPIALRYPLVELANALFYLALFIRLGPTPGFLLMAAIVTMFIALIYIDADIQILPDVIDLPGTLIGLAIATLALVPEDAPLTVAHGWRESVIGAFAGAGILFAIGASYKLLRRIEGMGLGDVKMMAMIGSVVGWRWLFAVLMFASVFGAVIGILAALRMRSTLQIALPFGVFLGMATLAVIFFGDILYIWLPTLRWGG